MPPTTVDNPDLLAAGYSVVYAAAGAGYAATGSLAGPLLREVAPSTAILAGVGLTLTLTTIGWWGETRRAARPPRHTAHAATLTEAAGPILRSPHVID
ncbi:hypothetical protein QA802_18760 [Streptomyces sp. B21-105]|uniref:hypothetical protein n=1 Tax=Streptomyces sp. B21-105 TaxID=3039417 RepID=UPI002FF3A3BB